MKSLWFAALAACTPTLVDETTLVDTPRLLAIQSEPAEAPPGAAIALHALASDPAALDPSWAFCTTRRPIAAPGSIDPRCLTEADASAPAGTGLDLATTLPAKGCELFGPDQPPPTVDQPSGRPADPDGTGGYYQPIRAGADDVGFVRITCNLAGATPEQATEYRARTRPNANPVIAGARLDGDAVHVDFSPPETYVYFDPIAHALVDRDEVYRISWFATAGRFAAAHTGTGDNTWTGGGAGDTVWIVVRDDRGGVAWTVLTN